eukprot:tig00000711_g3413.t1
MPPANPYYTEWQDGAAAVSSECKRQPLTKEKLILTRGTWDWQEHSATRHRLVGRMRFENLHPRHYVYIPEIKAEVQLLASESTGRGVDNCKVRVKITSEHPDEESPARPDGFWFAYILQHKKYTNVLVEIEIEAEEGTDLTHLQSAYLQVHYTVYGRNGVDVRTQAVVLPMTYVPPGPPQALPQNWQRRTNAMVLPVKTHLLTHLDDPVRIVERYIMPLYKPGDIVAIAESPLAVMQGRYRHFREVRYTWLAVLLCRLFDNASSLSTAVGMQSLIDIVGPLRVIFAAIGAVILRVLFKRRGAFYELAGEQARLIDEVTGSMPPYDQCVVLGPENAVQAVREIRARTGVEAAVVDVNDLHRVKVLAGTPGVRDAFLGEVLLDNPAGNANQQTPLVLVRPL